MPRPTAIPLLVVVAAIALPACPTTAPGANDGTAGPAATTRHGDDATSQRAKPHDGRPTPSSNRTAALPPPRREPPSRLTNFRAVWAAAPKAAFIGGDDGMLLRWDGAVWCRAEPTYHDGIVHPWLPELYGLWGASATDVWAAGTGFIKGRGSVGTILHFDGKRWAPSGDLVDGSLRAVWGSSARDVWAVGTAGMLLHFDGSGWSRTNSPTDANLMAIDGTGSNDVWAVGAEGTAIHFDGKSWSTVPTGAKSALVAAWAGGTDDVWAAASHSEPLLRYDGSNWREQPRPGNEGLLGLWGSGPTDVWAVGIGVVLRWDGNAVTGVPATVPGAIQDIAGTGPNDIWMVGAHVLQHWDGSRWRDMIDRRRGGKGELPCPAR